MKHGTVVGQLSPASHILKKLLQAEPWETASTQSCCGLAMMRDSAATMRD